MDKNRKNYNLWINEKIIVLFILLTMKSFSFAQEKNNITKFKGAFLYDYKNSKILVFNGIKLLSPHKFKYKNGFEILEGNNLKLYNHSDNKTINSEFLVYNDSVSTETGNPILIPFESNIYFIKDDNHAMRYTLKEEKFNFHTTLNTLINYIFKHKLLINIENIYRNNFFYTKDNYQGFSPIKTFLRLTLEKDNLHFVRSFSNTTLYSIANDLHEEIILGKDKSINLAPTLLETTSDENKFYIVGKILKENYNGTFEFSNYKNNKIDCFEKEKFKIVKPIQPIGEFKIGSFVLPKYFPRLFPTLNYTLFVTSNSQYLIDNIYSSYMTTENLLDLKEKKDNYVYTIDQIYSGGLVLINLQQGKFSSKKIVHLCHLIKSDLNLEQFKPGKKVFDKIAGTYGTITKAKKNGLVFFLDHHDQKLKFQTINHLRVFSSSQNEDSYSGVKNLTHEQKPVEMINEACNDDHKNIVRSVISDEVTKKYQELQDRLSCCICFEEEKSILTQPCLHMSMCENCYKINFKGKDGAKCPICTEPIKKVKKIFY